MSVDVLVKNSSAPHFPSSAPPPTWAFELTPPHYRPANLNLFGQLPPPTNTPATPWKTLLILYNVSLEKLLGHVNFRIYARITCFNL